MAGSVVGAVVITLLPEFLYQFEEYRLLVYGVILLLVVIFAPKGIVGLFSSFVGFVRGKLGGEKVNEPEEAAEREQA